ncbi:hypothetical protein L3081_23360 [Colwellia sp. MSW7]|uniref:Uncharacterized protein n=1 Tax=Colwellia maritima TaxID=2912588 RepID=A0ABS9X6B0_9GAMM|nr:hypothetical protein [Colwellia maritima]MCI2285778.1 hypothetical protein [Colwellia maritima]
MLVSEVIVLSITTLSAQDPVTEVVDEEKVLKRIMAKTSNRLTGITTSGHGGKWVLN